MIAVNVNIKQKAEKYPTPYNYRSQIIGKMAVKIHKAYNVWCPQSLASNDLQTNISVYVPKNIM